MSCGSDLDSDAQPEPPSETSGLYRIGIAPEVINKGLSACIAAIMLIVALCTGGFIVLPMTILFLGFSLSLIWFGDEVGSIMGVMRGHSITSESPGWLVALFGWLLLLSPIILTIISAVRSSN